MQVYDMPTFIRSDQNHMNNTAASIGSIYTPDESQETLIQLQLETAKEYKLGHFFADTLNDGSNGPELAIIPAGSFEMGSNPNEFGHEPTESPAHYVAIKQPFAIGRCTITANQFDTFRQATNWYLRPELLWNKGEKPVTNIRQSDAKLYLEWLSDETGHKYRLPTEAEWEYATRAGTSSAFHFGNTISCKEVHFDPVQPYNEAKEKRRWFMPRCVPLPMSIEVASKPANAWGLYEVHGNVWEYTCSPWTASHINANRDGSPSTNNHSRWYVTKGGSWFDAAKKARSAARMKRLYDELDTNLGFRVLREL